MPTTIELGESIQTPAGFARLIPGNLKRERFIASDYLASSMLRGVAHSTGFALIDSGKHSVGANARWLPLPI